MKWPTLPTQAPSRGLPRTSGSFSSGVLRSLAEPCRRQGFAGDVRYQLGQIADAALCIENSRSFPAARAEANELHGCSLALVSRTAAASLHGRGHAIKLTPIILCVDCAIAGARIVAVRQRARK